MARKGTGARARNMGARLEGQYYYNEWRLFKDALLIISNKRCGCKRDSDVFCSACIADKALSGESVNTPREMVGR